MKRYALFCSLLLLAGCQNTIGPFGPRPLVRPDDPSLPIPEQQRRGRSMLSLPEDSYLSGPRTNAAPFDASGGR
jgi:hypothetical protein